MSNAPPLGPERRSGNGTALAFAGVLAAVALMVAAGVLTFVYVRHLQDQVKVAEARAEQLTFTKGTGRQMLPLVFADSGAQVTTNEVLWIDKEGMVLGSNEDLHRLSKNRAAYDAAVAAFLQSGTRAYRRSCVEAESKDYLYSPRRWNAGYCIDVLTTPR